MNTEREDWSGLEDNIQVHQRLMADGVVRKCPRERPPSLEEKEQCERILGKESRQS